MGFKQQRATRQRQHRRLARREDGSIKTGDERDSQGWTPFILDTNGNGKRSRGLCGAQPAGRSRQGRTHSAGFYGIAPNPVDGSIDPGLRAQLPRFRRAGRSRRQSAGNGAGRNLRSADARDIRRAAWKSTARASYGRRWAAGTWRGFDRRKLREGSPSMVRPRRPARRCPGGLELVHRRRPRSFKGVADEGRQRRRPGMPDWVDQFDTLGLGDERARSRRATARMRCMALVDGKWVTLRVPYPIGLLRRRTWRCLHAAPGPPLRAAHSRQSALHTINQTGARRPRCDQSRHGRARRTAPSSPSRPRGS